MGRWSEGLRKLKKRADCVNQRAGISMAIVICIGALLIAFSLAMAYTGSLMMATANTRLEEERAYQLAKSFAEVLDAELAKDDLADDGNSVSSENWSEFYTFARRFIGNAYYADYDSMDADGTVYTYTATSTADAGKYGKVKVKLSKILDTEYPKVKLEKPSGGDMAKGYADELGEKKNTDLYRYRLVVEVVASYEDSQYSYKTVYRCKERLGVKLTAEKADGTTKTLNYDGEKFIDSSTGSEFTDWENYDLYCSYITNDDSTVTTRTFEESITEKTDE